jgi:hypothetical protein
VKRGYDINSIEKALDYIGTVPSMRQMDLVLRGKGVQSKSEINALKAVELAEKFNDEPI